jgi:hypothetical protein
LGRSAGKGIIVKISFGITAIGGEGSNANLGAASIKMMQPPQIRRTREKRASLAGAKAS